MSWAFKVALAACFLPFLFVVIDKIFAIEYKVHEEGIVLVTGASTGIGRHAVEFLANQTKYTILVGVRKQADATAITDMNKQNLIPLMIDVAQHDSVVNGVNEVRSVMSKKKLPLVALVNNAGISRHIALENHAMEDLKLLFETNVFGMIDLTQQLLPDLRDSQGRIVMISSIAGKVSRPLNSIYAASKFAMEAISDSLRREVAHMGVSVSVVEPAYVKSEIFGKVKETKTKDSPSIRKESKDATWPLYDKFRTPEKAERNKIALSKADDPIVSSVVIHHAITDSKPLTRYPVANFNGIPAWVITVLVQYIPDRVLDFIIAL